MSIDDIAISNGGAVQRVPFLGPKLGIPLKAKRQILLTSVELAYICHHAVLRISVYLAKHRLPVAQLGLVPGVTIAGLIEVYLTPELRLSERC